MIRKEIIRIVLRSEQYEPGDKREYLPVEQYLVPLEESDRVKQGEGGVRFAYTQIDTSDEGIVVTPVNDEKTLENITNQLEMEATPRIHRTAAYF